MTLMSAQSMATHRCQNSSGWSTVGFPTVPKQQIFQQGLDISTSPAKKVKIVKIQTKGDETCLIFTEILRNQLWFCEHRNVQKSYFWNVFPFFSPTTSVNLDQEPLCLGLGPQGCFTSGGFRWESNYKLAMKRKKLDISII